MRLPPTKKILREDVKDAPAWISAIIEPFNSFAESVYQTLNRNVTYSENIACFIKEIIYKTSSGYPVEASIEFANELKVKATGVQLLQALDRATYKAVEGNGAVYVPWVDSNGVITIGAITGLQASRTYIIRLLIT